MDMTRRQQDQQSKLFDELSTLIQTILTFSPTTSIEFPDGTPAISAAATGGSSSSAADGQAVRRREFSLQQITPSGFASFLLVVSSLSMLGRAIFCPNSTPSSPRKEFSIWKAL